MGIQDPVEGEFRIRTASKPPTSSSVASCDMVGEVSGPGISPRVQGHTAPFAPLEKWPRPGDVLPVIFDRDNPEFLKIEWKKVPERG